MEILLILYLIGLLVFGAFKIFKPKKKSDSQYDKKSHEPSLYTQKIFLSVNEEEFLHRLEAAAPELRFHAQVAMGAVLNPNVSRYQKGGDYYRLRSQFSQKIIDYVAQDRKSGNILAIIELDDASHDPERDAYRDSMLEQAGYRVIRWHSRKKPDIKKIRQVLFDEDDE